MEVRGEERRGEERRGGEPSVNHSTRVRNVVTETILLPAVFAFVAVMVLLSSWTSTSIHNALRSFPWDFRESPNIANICP